MRLKKALVGIAATLTLAPAAAQATSTLYVAPDGTGTACTQAAPCPLVTGWTATGNGDTLVVDQGTYTTATAVLLDDGGAPRTVKGAVIGIHRPVLHGYRIRLQAAGSLVTDLELDGLTGQTPLDTDGGATADRILAVSDSADACAAGSGSIYDSVCDETGGAGDGASVSGGLLKGVTAVGQTNGIAATKDNVNIESSAAQGGTADICAEDYVTATVYDSAYVTQTGTPCTGTIRSQGAHRGRLVTANGFREDSTSPTIDAGSNSNGPKPFDLDGNYRDLENGPDIGAYEYVSNAPAIIQGSVGAHVTAHSATVYGRLTDHGAQTDTTVTYSTGGGTVMTTAPDIVAPDFGQMDTSIALTGLASKTTYTYQLKASSDGGNDQSAQLQFTTPPEAPTAHVDAPSNITATTATLHGTIATDAAPATVHFEVTPQGGSASITPDQTKADGPVSADLSGLAPNTAYAYTLDVDNGGGTAHDSGTFTTPPLPPVATADSVTGITNTTATLHGTVALKGASGTARFAYGSALTGEQGVSADGPVTATLTGLAPNTHYAWKTRVQTAGGLVESATQQFTTLPDPPTAVTGAVSQLTATSAHLAGTADTKGVPGQIAMLVDGKATGEATRTGGDFSVDVTGLKPGSSHVYQLRVITTGGTQLGASKAFTTPLPLGAKMTVANGQAKHQLSLKRPYVTVRATCTGVACAVKLSAVVKAGKKTLGRFKIRAVAIRVGKAKSIRLPVPKALARRLAKSAKITITGVFEGGATSVTRRITLAVRHAR